MPAPTLVALCRKACIRSLRSITDVGNFEYWKIRDVLMKITVPEQLEEIERNSPQIRGEDAELWKAFIARDIPDYEKMNWAPKNPLNWCQVYKKYKRWQQRAVEEDKERLKQAMLGIQKEKAQHLTKAVSSKSLPKQPRDPRMLSNDGGVPISIRKKGFAKPPSSSLSFAGGSRTKMTNPGSVLTRAIREAKEISARQRLGQPSHQLLAPRSQIHRAPQSMMDEYRKAAVPDLKIYTPRNKRSDLASNSYSNGPTLEERERRLKAMKMTRSDASQVTLVGSDSEDDDDLFGDKVSASVISSPPRNTTQESRQRPSPIVAKPLQSSPIPKLKPLPAKSSPAPNGDIVSSMVAKRKPTAAKFSEVAKPPQEDKPSDIIFSLISQGKRKRETESHLSSEPKDAPPPRTLSSGLGSPPGDRYSSPARTSSPMRGMPPPVLRRKKPVDIFNRTGTAITKKPRLL